MKKVLFVVSTLRRSGPVNVVFNIIRYLDRGIYSPIVLTLSPEGKDSLSESFQNELAVPVYSLKLNRFQAFYKARGELKCFIEDKGIDLIHSHGIRSDWLVRHVDVPTVSTLHNYPFEDYVYNYGSFLGKILAKSHLSFLKTIDKPYVVSKTISEILLREHDYKIGFVRNGVDSQKFRVRDKSKLRVSLDLPESGTIFLFVGHLSPLKDPITVIKAFKEANVPNSTLVILGDGGLLNECLKEIESNTNIKMCGRVGNVEDYFSACDVYISSSLTESFQLTVLEAVFSGMYCVLSDLPVRREMISLGLEFSIFKPRDHIQLANIIFDLNLEILTSTIWRNREVAESFLSADKMSNEYQNIYSTLV